MGGQFIIRYPMGCRKKTPGVLITSEHKTNANRATVEMFLCYLYHVITPRFASSHAAIAMEREQESFELQGFHNPLAAEFDQSLRQENTDKQIQLSEDRFQDDILKIKQYGTRRWKLIAFALALLAVGCVAGLVYVVGQRFSL